ncbi:MAG: helix-turn-helix domain-containing protein [Alphaproteobacteria bacterium]
MSEKNVAEILKEARKKQKKEIKTAAKKLCIRKVYIEALEADNLKDLPGMAYTIGFLRNYASYLKLNSDKIVEAYKKEHPVKDEKKEEITDDTVPLYKKRNYVYLHYFLIFTFVAILFLAIYGLVNLFSDNKKEVEIPQISNEFILPDEEILEPTVLSETIDEEEKIDTIETEKRQEEKIEEVSEEVGLTSSKIEEKPEVSSEVNAQETDTNKIVLLAEEEVWIELKNVVNGRIVFSKLLKTGEQYEMQENKNISLTVGNAGGLQVILGGEKLNKLGPRGFRRSHIRMGAEQLKTRSEKQ